MFVWYLMFTLYFSEFLFSEIFAENNSRVNELKYNKYFKNSSVINSTNLPEAAKEIVSQVITKQCSHQYSITCLKVDLSKLLNKLETTKSLQIFPGISLINTENITNVGRRDLPVDIAVSIIRSNNNSSELNSYLTQKIGSYLGSLSVRVNLFDNSIFQNLKQMAYSAFSSIFYPIEESGRSKKKQDVHAAMWSAAMLAALAFSGLAALAGKAMLTGALALVLSLICLLKGCHGGHKASHYEIITKPAHDAEHIGIASALGSSPSYAGFARNLLEERRIIPASINILDTDTSEEKDSETKVISIPAYHVSPSFSTNSLLHR